MKLTSFSYKGKVYALYIGEITVLYTDKKILMFNSYYEAIDWLKYR